MPWFFLYPSFLSDEGPMLETLDHTIRIGSTPTFLYFDLYLYSAYAAHYVYIYIYIYITRNWSFEERHCMFTSKHCRSKNEMSKVSNSRNLTAGVLFHVFTARLRGKNVNFVISACMIGQGCSYTQLKFVATYWFHWI